MVGDSRSPFDTVNGVAGGNEFTALTPEGHRVLENETGAKATTSTKPVAATAAAAPQTAAISTTPVAATAATTAQVAGKSTPPVAAAAATTPQMTPMSITPAAATGPQAVTATSTTPVTAASATTPQLAAMSALPAAGTATGTASGENRIAIDANAFAAVFGPYTAPLKPSAAQLMQLDALSLVAADATRITLQQQILACRRAGEACRLAASGQ